MGACSRHIGHICTFIDYYLQIMAHLEQRLGNGDIHGVTSIPIGVQYSHRIRVGGRHMCEILCRNISILKLCRVRRRRPYLE